MITKRRALASARDWRATGFKFSDRASRDDISEADRCLFEASADFAFAEAVKFDRLANAPILTRLRWDS